MKTATKTLISLALLLLFSAPAWAQETAQGEICTNTCGWAGDGECDDGGVGSQYRVCSFGTDCNDCGPRNASQLRGLKPLGGLAFGNQFRIGLSVGLHSADHEEAYVVDAQHKQWIPLVSDGLSVGVEGRWIGLVRTTFAGNLAGADLRFGLTRFQASVDSQPDTAGTDPSDLQGVDDGQLRYGLYIDPLLRFDRPIGRAHGITISLGPSFSLYGVAMLAEFSPRIAIGDKLALEPRAGILASNYADRELNFGLDASVKLNDKLTLVGSYMMSLGEMVRGSEHSYTHHTITVSLGF